MVKMDFGGVKEDVITRKEFTVAQAQKILKDEVVVSLGYGIQGRAQSLNMRDNGVKVIIGQEKEGIFKKEWDKAVADGWVPGENLFPLEEAAKKGTIKMFLLTDCRTKSSMAKNQSHPQSRRRTLLQPRILASSTKNKQALSHPKTSTLSWLHQKAQAPASAETSLTAAA